jgi:hypothetical protein
MNIRECLFAEASAQVEWNSRASRIPFADTLAVIGTYHETKIFETIDDVGPGVVYTECDGVPRFRPIGPPTSRITRYVTVTQERTELGMTLVATQPEYTFKPCRPKMDPEVEDPRRREFLEACQAAWNEVLLPSFNRTNELGAETDYAHVMEDTHCGELCQIEAGQEVVLLYWPPVVTSRDICSAGGYGTATTISQIDSSSTPVVVTMDAITFRGQDVYLRTITWTSVFTPIGGKSVVTYSGANTFPRTFHTTSILFGPFTFTSPMVYIAHHSLVAKNTAATFYSNNMGTVITDATGGVHTEAITIHPWWNETLVRPAGVITLNPDQVFSVQPPRADFRQVSGLDYAKQVAGGTYTRYQGDLKQLGFRSFDYGHLKDPVPASIYYDALYDNCWGDRKNDPCATLTDGRYRPPLAFLSKVWNSVLGDYAHCDRPQLVDPPIDLVDLKPDKNGQADLTHLSLPTLASIHSQIGSPNHAHKTLANSAGSSSEHWWDFPWPKSPRPEHRLDSPWPKPTSFVRSDGQPSGHDADPR